MTVWFRPKLMGSKCSIEIPDEESNVTYIYMLMDMVSFEDIFIM